MLANRQIELILDKLTRFEEFLGSMLFEEVDTVPVKYYATKESLQTVPEEDQLQPCEDGTIWSTEEGTYGWFQGYYTVPEKLHGKNLFVRPYVDGTEAMLFVDGIPAGTFNTKFVVTDHGNHYCDMVKLGVTKGEVIKLALEYYAGHYVKGCMPFEETGRTDYTHRFHKVAICIKNEEINDFYFDLRTLNQLVKNLDANSFRRADVINTMVEAHKQLLYSLEDTNLEEFMNRIRNVAPLLKAQLQKKNSESAPEATIIGHSHMDTAWLWHIEETVKKCARTYSNQMSLMKQYPEYLFVQSSAYHSKMIQTHYKELFEEIKEMVQKGRYEPNGGVFVECDCNIPNGEFMIRQFLWGQNFTKKEFGYESNSFWLPDTFGYSQSLPQIIKGCHIDYFLTTKMAWADTTNFPYDTFYWQGIDGTKVLTHLNKTHIWPDVNSLMDFVIDGPECIKEKTVTNKKLLSYGMGDGGGGPQFEMIEMSRRLRDLEGVPKAKHGTVGEFMKQLEETVVNPSTYADELYLELHRGTLTNQHTIKKNNRDAEVAIHDLEYMIVRDAINEQVVATDELSSPLVESLLINQFHDILPGTCIPRAHDEAIKEVSNVIEKANNHFTSLVKPVEGDYITFVNTLPITRNDTTYVTVKENRKLSKGKQQKTDSILYGEVHAVTDLSLDAFEAKAVEILKEEVTETVKNNQLFTYEGNQLETPFYSVTFESNMTISSLVDKEANRQLRGDGYPLNTFLIAEDLPSAWDNWDINADLEMKYEACSKLLKTEVISCGDIELRIRNWYQISENSTIVQDMIFYGNSREIRFETKMDWQDNHRFLKTAFDTTIFSDFVRNEIQFGYIKRPTTRSTDVQKAKFEVCNHKYTDLSEHRYGMAILNDGKYGISCEGRNLRLSLHKGGTRPDYRGDKGIHVCTYSIYPHNEGFGAESVVVPAYQLNYPVKTVSGKKELTSFVSVLDKNIWIESIKPCEEEEQAFIMRLYEVEGTTTNTKLQFAMDVTEVKVTDMLENELERLEKENDRLALSFRPFEIKTIKVNY